MTFRRISGTILILAAVGCGQDAAPPASTSTPAAAPASPAAAPKPAATLTLIEPIEGAMAATETKLQATVALEPEVHTWMVSARKGSEVLATSVLQKFTITP